MGITIHKVLPEDANAYTVCHVACWRAAYRGILPDDYLKNMDGEIGPRTERLAQMLDEPSDIFFFYAADGNRMMGRLVLGKSRDADRPDAGEIQALYLLEEYWDKGIGRQLMDRALDLLRGMGYREVILWVLEENRRARCFYEKCGFALDGRKQEIEIGRKLVELRYTRAL